MFIRLTKLLRKVVNSPEIENLRPVLGERMVGDSIEVLVWLELEGVF